MVRDVEDADFATISVHKLHLTFGAQVNGVNFQEVTDQQFAEILRAMAKVRYHQVSSSQLGRTSVGDSVKVLDRLARLTYSFV